MPASYFSSCPRRFTPAIFSITAHTAAVSSIAWPVASAAS